MIIHNLTNFHQNRMLSSPLIVFTDKVTDTQTDRQTKVITIPLHILCGGVKNTHTSFYLHLDSTNQNCQMTSSILYQFCVSDDLNKQKMKAQWNGTVLMLPFMLLIHPLPFQLHRHALLLPVNSELSQGCVRLNSLKEGCLQSM